MEVKRSTGIKRISITCTVVLPIVFFSLSFAAYDAFSSSSLGAVLGWFGLISIFLPAIVYKVGYWIADGFQRDRE